MAEETSDLNTDDDTNASKKRKRTQRILSSSDDECVESLLEPLPNITMYKKKEPISTNVMDMTLENVPSGSNIHLNAHTSNVAEREVTTPNPEQCKNCIEKDKQFKTLIQQGHILRGIMTDALNEVKQIKQLLIKGREEIKLHNTSFFQNEDLSFPIKLDEEFDKFEEYLQNQEHFTNAVEEISKLGGQNTYDFIKRVMQLTLSNDQALKYSWQGLKGNKKFKETCHSRFLLKAAEMTGLPESQKASETAIQTWLRRASDRKATKVNKTF